MLIGIGVIVKEHPGDSTERGTRRGLGGICTEYTRHRRSPQ